MRNDPIYVMIERLTVLVLEKIAEVRTPNPCDMFDLQERSNF